MRALISLLLLFVFVITVNAQQGIPFITEIEFNRQFNDSRISSMVQHSEEPMFYATARGILKFDGATWDRINTTSPALQLHRHVISNRIFVGLKQGAAEILKTDSGTYEIQPISALNSDNSVVQILSTNNEVFFIGETELFRYAPLLKEDADHFEYSDRLINGAFLYNTDLYLFLYQEGLFKWEDGHLEEVGKHQNIAEDQVLFSFETSEGTFIGLENDALYRFSDGKLVPVEKELRNFLSENILSDGLIINDSLMAFSTLAGGAVVVSIADQSIRFRFDYTTGINDNEIFCLGTDKDQGLWLAYESGLSRIDLMQPIKSLGGYPGLDGNLTSAIMLDGKLHVATGNGVFVLKEAKNKAEIQQIVAQIKHKKREAIRNTESNYVPPIPARITPENREVANLLQRYKEDPEAVKLELTKKELRELKKKIRQQKREERNDGSPDNLFEYIFQGNENKEKNTEEKKPSGPNAMKELTAEPKTGAPGSGMRTPPGGGAGLQDKQENSQDSQQVQAKPKREKKSYLYKKINGLDVKCRQLITWNNQLFAATNNGLYLIKNQKATNLTPHAYINQVVVSNNGKSLLLATLTGVYRLSKKNAEWKFEAFNDSIQFAAYNVIQDSEGSVWAGADNGAYRYFLNEAVFYGIPKVANERVLVAQVYGQVHFLLSSGLFHYVADTDTILPANLPEIPAAAFSSGGVDYLLGNNGVVWIQSTFGWHVLNGDTYISLLPYLDLFENIRQLSTDENGNLYVIDNGNDIFSINNKQPNDEQAFKVYIRQALSAEGVPFPLEKLSVNAKNNLITFTISAPFYLKSEATQYQYRIEGLRNTWTKWSYETEIEQYVLAGDYTLQVRAKNVLGEISEIKTLAFSVEKPIWLRWYFILLYVLVLVTLVLGVIKIRERSLRETQRELEAMVEKRTADLARSKERAEELLLNILPKETAEELQKNGKATARHYNQVSVLFTDFKGFTRFAENTTPEKLVSELHRCFSRFDEIIEKYELEKIKTIGDAYMCAGGVPVKNSSNPIRIALAALEIRDYMDEVVAIKTQRGEPILEIRIGIHTGPLTAGVVGKKKFAYDIWGDTVNTASRMETASEPGQVNVSGTTYELIKKYFDTETRGKREAKGKGLVEMYFVKKISPHFSEGGKGIVPNKEMWNVIS